MIPSAKTATCSSAPPENRLRKLRIPPEEPAWLDRLLAALELTPGTVMWAPRRYSPSISAVKPIFLRISGTESELRIVLIIQRSV